VKDEKEQLLEARAVDLMARAARVLPSTDTSVLDSKLGPSDSCYSVRDVVNLFRRGASEEDLIHLSECESCRVWINSYAQRPSAFWGKSERKGLFKGVAALLGIGVTQPEPQPALLHVCKAAISINDLNRPMEFAVLTGTFDDVDIVSLRMDGALLAEDGSLQKQALFGDICYPVIRFNSVKLADKVREDIGRHVALTDRISISGSFTDKTQRAFRGHAHVRVVSDAAIIPNDQCH